MASNITNIADLDDSLSRIFHASKWIGIEKKNTLQATDNSKT
jgi:hypothetical protein